MLYENLFSFLIVTNPYEETSVTGQLIDEITDVLSSCAFTVKHAYSTEDAKIAIESDPAIGCFLIEWGVNFQLTANGVDQQDLITYIREIGLKAPIYLITEKRNVMEIPASILEIIDGCVFPQEQTPHLIADYMIKAFQRYIDTLKTPFFGGMIDYVEAGNDMWLAPGHNSGEFYRKSPIGRIFYEFIGENFFRADFNFVPDLGDIFGHTGPFGEAERQAAKIFGAERTYFVLNGTTTSNKIVNCATVAKDDLVLYDRNNHKSNVQSALMINGGIPIYLPNDRNSYGMVGPIDYSYLDEDRLRQLIKENPLLKGSDAWMRQRPFRVAIIENCTYDGTIYHVKTIIEKIGHLCDYIFFDEAWGAFMAFHDIYKERYGLSLTNLSSKAPGIFVTQSTHKQLAGMSQASQIHVKDSHLNVEPEKHRQVQHRRLNEVFMMHTSTSPFYPMFASLDVGAQMMKGQNGRYLWNEAIKLAIDIRIRIRKLKEEYQQNTDISKRWFFDPFVPDEVTIQSVRKKWEDLSTDMLAKEQSYWHFNEKDTWHGYTRIKDGYVMVDPTKMLLLTPGINKNTGEFEKWGIPASILASYLRSKGVVPEKSDFYSVLFLVTPAIERSKAGKLLAELVKFKELVDSNALVKEVVPSVVEEHPDVYENKGINTLCQEIHDFLVEHDVAKLQKDMFQTLPEIAMTPQKAHNALIANNVEYLPISKLDGRVAATLVLSYPPGVAVVMPGERYGERTKAQLAYFKMFEEMGKRFPGFENEIQGFYLDNDENGNLTYHTYVVKDEIGGILHE